MWRCLLKPDVLVIGAGPAGMSASLTLSEAGARVRVVDEQYDPGGQIYRAVDRVKAKRPDSLRLFDADYARGAELTHRFRNSNIEFSSATSVWDIVAGDLPAVGVVDAAGAEMIYPDHVVLATGAMERPTPFPGWTLPGVMGVGAAQTLLKESALVPSGRVVIAGTGPLVLLFVRQLIAAGVKPEVILDTGPAVAPAASWAPLLKALVTDPVSLLKGAGWLREIRAAGVRRVCRVSELRAIGDQALSAVEYERKGKTRRVDADLLLIHDGVIPNTHLAMAAGCKHRWHALQRCWGPVVGTTGVSSQPWISIAGDSVTIAGAQAAACSGRVVGLDVARRLGFVDARRCELESAADLRHLAKIAVLREFLDQFYQPLKSFQVPSNPATVVCRCEEVTAGEIREVAAMGCIGPNQGKALTRCGMGPCMGRECGNTVSQILADYHKLDVSQIGHYQIRPPVRPLTVGQLAELRQ